MVTSVSEGFCMSPVDRIRLYGLDLPSNPSVPIYTFGAVKPHRFERWPEIIRDIEYFSTYHHDTPLVHLQGKEYVISRKEAEAHYAAHKGKPFFGRLVDMMTEGPSYGFILVGENAIDNFRKVVGPTYPKDWKPFTIRHKHGEPEKGISFNAIHASDSPKSFVDEVELHFDRSELDEMFWAYVEHYKAHLDALKGR